ncbi:MAG: hypothetical protein WD270_01130 [Acetobacterales bacterium]
MTDYFDEGGGGDSPSLATETDIDEALAEIDRRLNLWSKAESKANTSAHIVFAKGLTIQRKLDEVRDRIAADPGRFGGRFESRLQRLQRRIDGYVGTLRAASLMQERLRSFDESYWQRQLVFSRWVACLNGAGIAIAVWIVSLDRTGEPLHQVAYGAMTGFGAGVAAAVFSLVLMHLGAMKSAIEMLPRLSAADEDAAATAHERRRTASRRQIVRWQTMGGRLNATSLVVLILAAGYGGFGAISDYHARKEAIERAAETRWQQHHNSAPRNGAGTP